MMGHTCFVIVMETSKQTSTLQKVVSNGFRTKRLALKSNKWPIWAGISLQRISYNLSVKWQGQGQVHRIFYTEGRY